MAFTAKHTATVSEKFTKVQRIVCNLYLSMFSAVLNEAKSILNRDVAFVMSEDKLCV